MKANMQKLCGSINGMMGALGFALGIAGLARLGKEAVETASDISEVQNVVDTAFGDMAYKMERFADVAVKQFGMSRLSAKEMGSTFMAMGASMVDSMEDASDMEIALTGRAADMASFYNKSAQETATALKSIYTGETETLKTYGIVMTEINLAEYAAEKGIHKKLSAMSQAEKVQLRYSYVMSQTALAAGDFAKTSDSWANQTRILSEQLKELLSVIGGLITAFIPVVRFLNTVLSQLIAIAQQVGAVLSRLLGISVPVADAKKFSEDMSSAAGGAEDVADGIEEAGKQAKKALAPFDDLMVLADKGGSGKNGAGAGAAGGGFEMPKLDMNEDVKPVETLTDGLKGLERVLSSIRQIISNITERFKEAWKANDVGLRIVRNIRDTLSGFAGHILNMIDATVAWTETLDFSPFLESVNTLLEALKPLIGNIGAGLEWFYTNALLPLAGWAIEDAVPAFLDMLAAGIDAVNAVIEVLKPLGEWLWESFLKPLAEWTGELAIAAMDAVTGLLEGFSDWITEHQAGVQAMTVTIGMFFAAWKVTELLGFIQMSGGVVAALTNITNAIKAGTVAKLADKLETMAIIALYAQDFVINLAKGTAELVKQAAQFAINTAAKLADTVAQWALTAATTAWNAICAVATVATTALGAAFAFLTSPIGLVVLAIGAIIAAIALCIIYWDDIKSAMGSFAEAAVEVWEGFKKTLEDIWGGIRLMFEGIIDFLTGAFTGNWKKAWDGVTETFEGVKETLKGTVNLIIGLIEGMVNALIDGVNVMLGALASIATIKNPVTGKAVWEPNIPSIPNVTIPRLATGAVIRGGNPFLAMLGDQPAGRVNVEAPADLIRDMARQGIREELSGLNLGERGANQVISLNVDGQEFARLTLGDFFSEMNRQGYDVQILGYT